MLRRPLGRGVPPARVLAARRAEPGLVALSGAWLGDRSGVEAVVASRPGRVVTDGAGLLAALDDLPGLEPDTGRPPGAAFGGGWLGVLDYQLGRHLEAVPPPAVEAAGPPGYLGWYESVWCYDGDGWWFEALVEDGREAAVEGRFEADRSVLAAAAGGGGAARPFAVGPVAAEPSLDDHGASVAAAIAAIAAGDVFQVNVTCQLVAPFSGDAVDLFGAGLERLAPRFAGFVRRPDGRSVCSLSPELFVRVVGRSVRSSPIKGTARRPDQPGAAEAARAALVASSKDGAENAMIVDLVRNDLGRVCTAGSVRVAALARAEAHPGVWHLVSDVVGELAAGETAGTVVASAFPAGSITGAPKVRAMELVSELEPVDRGAYTGSVGFASPLAGTCLNVAIRTFEVAGGTARLGVGGGIVADSSVAAEVEECRTKARPLLEAVGSALPTDPPAATGDAVLRPRPAAGVFETMRSVDGTVPLLDDHLARLAASAWSVLGRSLPADLAGRVLAAAAGAGGGAGRVRVAVRPGGASLRVEVEAGPLEPRRAGVRPPVARPIGLEPVDVAGGLGRHKWCDRRLLLALRPAGLAAEDQVLLVGAGGVVLEAERASVLCVVDGVLRTPGTDEAILPGVARALALQAAAAAGVVVKPGRLTLDEVAAASEVLVTNALRGVQRVGRVGAVALPAGPAPVTGVIEAAFAARLSPSAGRTPAPGAREGRPAPPAAAAVRWIRAGRPGGPGGALGGPVVVVDNVDSFTFNLTQALAALGASVAVVRSNAVGLAGLAGLAPAALVLSPGPCGPGEAGISVDAVRRLGPSVPTLGVCLGHQCIAAAYGADVVRAPVPVHGKTALVVHDGSALFDGVASPFRAARYHSLVVPEASLPPELAVSARCGPLVMGVRHRHHPVVGVQFHPESFLTGDGRRLLANFLSWAAR